MAIVHHIRCFLRSVVHKRLIFSSDNHLIKYTVILKLVVAHIQCDEHFNLNMIFIQHVILYELLR